MCYGFKRSCFAVAEFDAQIRPVSRQRYAIRMDISRKRISARRKIHVLQSEYAPAIALRFYNFQGSVREIPSAVVDCDGSGSRCGFYVRLVSVAERSGKTGIYQIIGDAFDYLGFRKQLVRFAARAVSGGSRKELRRAVLVRYDARCLPIIVELVRIASILSIRNDRCVLFIGERISFQHVAARTGIDPCDAFLRRTIVSDFHTSAVDRINLR